MNILLISQCHKNALKETRRILDQFAERCGDRTWQTAITQSGLTTLHKLLRQTARKNTAIACYWTHAKNLTELLWIVGDQRQFNEQGRVPTNRTKRNILRADDENTWQYSTSIQIVAVLAALLHDLGKATIGFQQKLKPSAPLIADPYRHEWLSLQLFNLMLKGCDSNEACLQRLADFKNYRTKNPEWYKTLTENKAINLAQLPPIAQFIGWLIVTHHRLPFLGKNESGEYIPYLKKIKLNAAQQDSDYINDYQLKYFYQDDINAIDQWVRNSTTQHKKPNNFWQLAADITYSETWQKQLTRWATKALNHPPLMQIAQTTISNPHFFYLARLALMVGDHNYSSLTAEDHQRVRGDKNFTLIANTDKATQQPKQKLDEHLIGVAKLTARFARLLPKLPKELPALQKNKAFTQRTKIKRFNWQNHAFDLAKNLQSLAKQQGFFGINMASTGCGKTLGNARIMYALSDPQHGARFTIALGLRILTLQTGEALQQKLHLNDEQITTLIGGQASRTLFQLNQQQLNLAQNITTDNGSESAESLVEGIIPNLDNSILNDEFATIIADQKARNLLNTPIVSCTVDHLVAASENKRGGKHIAPILRLLTADLILDEPDDFSQQDLPALARLVYLAGLFGSKILLSSATLTPDLITGLFNAYQAGRKVWQQQNNLPDTGIVCAWFDEFTQLHNTCTNQQNFGQTHQQFIEKRVQQLNTMPTKHMATVLPIELPAKPENKEIDYSTLAKLLLEQAEKLHQHHHITDLTDKTLSIGLIRIAHTKHLIATAQAIYQQQTPPDTQFHLCCYHARQLLILRSALENKLDRLLDRTDPSKLIQQPEIIKAIKTNSAKHHIFIIMATPVAEIGRDHDYDWAIIEPSSMRSIIQLAGRITRHRPDTITTTPNIAIMQSNIKALSYGNRLGVGEVCFTRPGFEDKKSLLTSHKIDELIPTEQLLKINAIPRIQKKDSLQPTKYLADLEHKVMEHLLTPQQPNYITAYWQPLLAHPATTHLQTITPFRYQPLLQQDYTCQLNGNLQENGGYNFRLQTKAWENPEQIAADTQNHYITYHPQPLITNTTIQPWLTLDLEEELNLLAEKLNHHTIEKTALQYATVSLEQLENGQHWNFHPWFGFWK